MEFTAILLSSLFALLSRSPVYLVWLVGLGLAIARWNKHPRVSLLTASGITIGLVTDLIVLVLQFSLPREYPAPELAGAFQVLGVCSALIDAVAWGLIIAAIFGWRKSEN